MYKEHCYETYGGDLLKDLAIFENWDLQSIVSVSDELLEHILQIDNAVPILPYFDSLIDRELVKLSDFLTHLSKCKDVRPFLKSYFKLELYKKARNPTHLYNSLFNVKPMKKY